MGVWSCIATLLLANAAEAVEIVCWGSNHAGQVDVPAGLGLIHDMSMGADHACALTELGQVICWGDDRFGQATVPAGLTGLAGVSCGGYHTCVWTTTGGVTCWGADDVGQSTVPGGVVEVKYVAAGWDDTCVLDWGGNITCWGFDDAGETVVPAGLDPQIGVDLGRRHSCSWDAAGFHTCWGANENQQHDLPLGRPYIDISVGLDHTCGLRDNGKVRCVGASDFQQLNVPGILSEGTNVAAGSMHTCAGRDGVMCWGGDNFIGQAVVPAEINNGPPLTVRSFHMTTCAFTSRSTTTTTTTTTVTTSTTTTSTSSVSTTSTTTSVTTSTATTVTATATTTTITTSTVTTTVTATTTTTETTTTETGTTLTETTSTVSSTTTSTTKTSTLSTTTATATTGTATTTSTSTSSASTTTTSTVTATTSTNTAPSTTVTVTTSTATTTTASTTTTTTTTTTASTTTTTSITTTSTTTATTTSTSTTTDSTTSTSTTTDSTSITSTTTTTASGTTTSETATISTTSSSTSTTTTSTTETATTTSETKTTRTVTRSTTTEAAHFFASVQVDVANVSYDTVSHARDNDGHWVTDTDIGRVQAVSIDPETLGSGTGSGSPTYVNVGDIALVPVELLRSFGEEVVVVVTQLSPEYVQRKVLEEATEDLGEVHGMVDVAVYIARTGERVGIDELWSAPTAHDIYVRVSERPEPHGRHPGWCAQGKENAWVENERMRKAQESELTNVSKFAVAPDWTPQEIPSFEALPKVDGDVDTSGVWCTGDHVSIYGFLLNPPIVYRCEAAHVIGREGLDNEDGWANSRRAWFLYCLVLFLMLAHVYASHSDRKCKAMDRDRMSERLLMTQLMAPGVRTSKQSERLSSNGHTNLGNLRNLPRTQQDATASLSTAPQTTIALLIRCSLETERHPTSHKAYPAEVLRLCFGRRGFLRRFRIFFQAFHPLSVLRGRPLEISCTKHAKLLTDTILFSLALLAFVFSANEEILHSSCDGENCPLLGFSWAFIYFLVVLFVLAVGLPSRLLASLLVPREIERRANDRRDSDRRLSDMMGHTSSRNQTGVDYRITHMSSDGRGARVSTMSSDGRAAPRMSHISSDGRGPRMSHLSSGGGRMSHISSDGGHRISVCESDMSEKRDKRARKTRRREQLFWLLGAVWTFLHLLASMAFLAHMSTRDAWKWETALALLLAHIIVVKPLFVALSLTLWTSFVARKWPGLVKDENTNRVPSVRSSKIESPGGNDELRELGNDPNGKGLGNDDLVLEGIDELQELELDEDTEEAVQKMANRGISVSQLLDFFQRLGADVMPQFDSVVATTEDVVRQAIIPMSRADANMVYGRPLKVRLGILTITEYSGRECDVFCRCEVLHRQTAKLETWPVPIVGLREVDYGMEAEMLGTEKYDTLEFSLIEADTEHRFCSGRLRAKNLDGDHEVPLINGHNDQVGVIAVQITASQQAMAPPVARAAIVPSSNQGYLEWCGEDELPTQPPSSSLAAEFCWAGSSDDKKAPALFADTEVRVSAQASRYSVSKENTLKPPARLPPLWDRSVEGTCYALAYGESTLPHKMVTHCWSSCFTHLVASVVADALNLETYGQLLPLLGAGDLGKLRSELGAADKLDTTYWIDIFCINQHKGICADVPNALDSMGVAICPCTCVTQKEASGPNCEIDKMPAVIAHLATKWGELGAAFTQVVAVDPGYGIFDRAWCLAELHESYLRNMPQTFMLHSYDDLDAQTQLAVVDGIDIRTSKSAHREDKQQILGKIDDADTFNEHVKSVVNFRMRNPTAPPTTRVSMMNVLIDNLLQ